MCQKMCQCTHFFISLLNILCYYFQPLFFLSLTDTETKITCHVTKKPESSKHSRKNADTKDFFQHVSTQTLNISVM